MSFEPPDDTHEDDEPLDYDDELEGVSTGSGGPSTTAIISLFGVVVALGLFLGPTLYRLAFGNTLGEPCNSGGDCRSGRCLQPTAGGSTLGMPSGTGDGICSDKCSSQSDCPSDLRCFQGDCAPKATADLGDSCTAPWDCRTGKCMVPREDDSPLGRSHAPGLDSYDDAIPGFKSYADSGTCKSQEQVEEMHRKIRQLRETQKKLRRLQEQFRQ